MNTLSKVMKRAWEIKREDSRNIFSICLKMAWEEIKRGVNTMVKATLKGYDWMVAKAEEIRDAQVKLAEREIEKFERLAANNKKNHDLYKFAIGKIQVAIEKYVSIEDAKMIYEKKNAMGFALMQLNNYVNARQ